MRIFQTSAICLLGACWFAGSTLADGQDSRDNTCRGIVGHNSFDLKPASAAAPQTPPPEIILNGIMTAFGDRSALFKVKPPQAAGKQYYFLSEGEQAGGIELLSVDVKAGTIKVRNQGVIQIIALCQPPRLLSIPGAAAPAGSSGINLPGNQRFPSENGQTGQSVGGKTPAALSDNSLNRDMSGARASLGCLRPSHRRIITITQDRKTPAMQTLAPQTQAAQTLVPQAQARKRWSRFG